MVAPVEVFELRAGGGEWRAYPRVCALWEEGVDCDAGVEVEIFANVWVLALFSGCMCVAVWGRGGSTDSPLRKSKHGECSEPALTMTFLAMIFSGTFCGPQVPVTPTALVLASLEKRTLST